MNTANITKKRNIVRCPKCGRTARSRFVLRQKPKTVVLFYNKWEKETHPPTDDVVYMCEVCDLEYYGDGQPINKTIDCVSEMMLS